MNEENTWKWQRVLFDKTVDELKWPPTSEDLNESKNHFEKLVLQSEEMGFDIEPKT